ncbi:ABC transporter ATP-binding protein [Lentisphaera profundi]|uniref:ABC transporter ATP-binding protein n=1 Tax=Lentisphaera profundi TaxID=1658616 RepID=A0ABY7VW75_9BACT|nr:ABC transporter ATP-binding protein [Lentisphaera profundi]WDE96313.1 ABC transporter ATP-binding protein [Lentisphaera profundi]
MSDYRNLRTFVDAAKKYKTRFILSFFLMPISAWLAVQGPAFIQHAIDDGLKLGKADVLIHFATLYIFVVLGDTVVSAVQNLLLQSGGIRSLSELRKKVVEHISFMGRWDYEKRPSGVLVSRATSDIESIGETFLQGVSYLITDSLKIIAVIWYIFSQDSSLGWITLLVLPPVVLMVNSFRIKLRRLYDGIRTVNGHLSASINESVAMRKEIELFNLDEVQRKQFSSQSQEYRDKSIKAISMDAFLYSFLEGLQYLTFAMFAFLPIFLINFNPGISTGLLIAWIPLLHQLFEPIKEMGSRFAVLQAAFAAMGKIGDILVIPLPADKGENEIEDSSISIKNLGFHYIESEPVLKNINLHIAQGSSLALVGPTGSGKSTLLKLLARLYEPTQGEILIGKNTLCSIQRDVLKYHVVMVPQEPAIFHESLLFNITLGRQDITLEMIEDVVKRSGLQHFVDSLENSYDSILDEGGESLSAGQRQLVALMRALVSPANILIFDEATANIDTETERLIQSTINFAMTKKTVIIVAHRLSTIRDSDQIAVLLKGELNGLGTHTELINDCYYYRCLHELEDINNV